MRDAIHGDISIESDGYAVPGEVRLGDIEELVNTGKIDTPDKV